MNRLYKSYALLGALMMGAAMGGDMLYSTPSRRTISKPKSKIPSRTPLERENLQKAYEIASEAKKHDFHIHGEIIRAKDKKTAIKIYNNSKKKKK